MEPLLKHLLREAHSLTILRKIHRCALGFILLALLGLISALGAQALLAGSVIGTESRIIQATSPVSKTIDTRQFIGVNKRGSFDTALSSWQSATNIIAQASGEIDNKLLKEGQDYLVSGSYSQACKTLLQAFGLNHQNCEVSDQGLQTLQMLPNSQLKADGLRSLSEVLRLVGRLENSQKVLSIIMKAAQPQSFQETSAAYLSRGNTQRALSERTRDFYNRTRERPKFYEALKEAKNALNYYQEAANADKSDSKLIWTQAQLNRLSLMLDIVQWLQETKEQLTGERWIPKIQDEIDAVESEQEKWGCQVQQQFQNTSLEIQQKLDSEIQEGLTAQEQLSRIYAQVNYALSLTRIKEISPIVCQTFDNSSVKELSSEKIGKLLEKTVESAKKLGNQPAEIYALGYYGQWYEKMHEFLEAQKQTEEALAIAQSLRLWDIAYQWQWQLGRIHKAKGETQNALAAYDAAFNTIQSLRDELLSAESDVQFAFRDRVEPIYREYVSLLLQRGLADEQTNLNKARKIISDLQLAELQNLLRCRFAELERNKTVPVEDVIAQEENAAIIYPIILKDGLEVILSLPKLPLRHYSPPNSTQQEVEVTLKQLRYSLEQPFFSKQGKEASKKLYEWLIRPLKTDLDSNQIKTLIFVLDGSLRNIPMAALYDGNQYLVKNYAIALAPGLKLPKSEPKKQFKALIAGLSEKPEFENSQDNEFGPLEYVETEVRNIEPLLKNAEVLRNKNFTSKALQEKINSSSYNVVHLATHGQFGFSRENTFIITASAEPRQYISAVNADKVDLNELDDVLQARDNDLIELLVLSACETATGDDREVLGIAGMAVQTGARSTLASLWNIDDPSTAELMKQFYTALVQQGKTKAEALRKAQEYLLDNSSVYKPSHWAPYVLVGDWR